MPSIIDNAIADSEAFLDRFRRAYLRQVGAERGITDLRDIALREATALIGFAMDPTQRAAGMEKYRNHADK